MFDEYLRKWYLVPDGAPLMTHSSRLLPVRQNGTAAMLKIAVEPEEKFGGQLMVWWDGQGAARVLAHEGDALLLERACGEMSLLALSHEGRDEDATRILCASVAELHRPHNKPLPELIPLTRWFVALFPAAGRYGGLFVACAVTARELLTHPQEEVVLHGDIHHQNILDFGERGWLAIDPKRLWGERGFDYANIFCNPDEAIATDRKVFRRRLDIVTEAARFERKRLLQWILAWSGLSAAWSLDDGDSGALALAVAAMAAEELSRLGE
ncbi:hypothetical protein IAD21_01558 [Abditibacteriota bacterium]|nr:hypothetical protein IAD21_01558 [Abditibacteriota bacterium]